MTTRTSSGAAAMVSHKLRVTVRTSSRFWSAVLYDTEGVGELLYVFDPAVDRGRRGKVVVRVNYAARLALDDADRSGIITNSIRTSGYVEPHNLREPRYKRIKGEVK